ncbi:MAG: 50S ribosomal protein L7/L12 [candidate division Zixibacteria bacterium]
MLKRKGITVSENKTIAAIVEKIENLTVLELADLSKELQDKFGVTAAAPVAVAAVPAAGGEAVAEEKTEFDVELQSAGDKKIQVIKVVRELTSLGLKEAKALVDNAPNMVKEGVTKEEAEAVRDKLQDVGAQVEIK